MGRKRLHGRLNLWMMFLCGYGGRAVPVFTSRSSFRLPKFAEMCKDESLEHHTLESTDGFSSFKMLLL